MAAGRARSGCGKLKEAKVKKGLTYAQLAEGRRQQGWLACAIDGQQWVPQEMHDKIARELGVAAADVAYRPRP